MQEVTRAEIKNRKTNGLTYGSEMDFTAAPAAAAGPSRSHHWRTEQKSQADRRTNTELPPHKK